MAPSWSTSPCTVRRVAVEHAVDGGAGQASRDRGALGRELVRQVRGERPHGDPPGDRRPAAPAVTARKMSFESRPSLSLRCLFILSPRPPSQRRGAHRPFTTLVKYTLSQPLVALRPEGERAPIPRSKFFSDFQRCRKPARVGLGPLRRSASTITLALTKPSRLRKLSCSPRAGGRAVRRQLWIVLVHQRAVLDDRRQAHVRRSSGPPGS